MLPDAARNEQRKRIQRQKMPLADRDARLQREGEEHQPEQRHNQQIAGSAVRLANSEQQLAKNSSSKTVGHFSAIAAG
jgi:hypothetical protein